MKEKYLNLVKNLRFYQDNAAYLQQVYFNKYLVICEQKVVGAYASYEEACSNADASYPSGIYLVKKCQQLANVVETPGEMNRFSVETKAA